MTAETHGQIPKHTDGSSTRMVPTGRQSAGIALVVLLALFIVVNRDDTSVSFLLVDVTAPLWVTLLVTALVGAAVGFLLSRRRYKH
jgi:uncharacterized integral membrane protein